MMQATDIQAPGLYWYQDGMGAPSIPIEVYAEGLARPDWQVQFFGREDADRLNDLAGVFLGPVPPPARVSP
jgi:hypothetical protein